MKNPLALLHEIHDMVTGIHTIMVGPREEAQKETLPGIDNPDAVVDALIARNSRAPKTDESIVNDHPNTFTEGEYSVTWGVQGDSVELDCFRSGTLLASLTVFPLEFDGNKDSMSDKILSFILSHLSWVGIGTGLVNQFAGPLKDEIHSLIHK